MVAGRESSEFRVRGISYIVMSRSDEGIVAQVATNVGRNNLAIDAVPRNKVLVHTSCATGSSTAGAASVSVLS